MTWYRVSQKKETLAFSSFFCSSSRILLFHMCFGIRISSPFRLATQIVSIQNLNYPKNAKNAAKTWFLECSSINVKCSSIFVEFSSIFGKLSSIFIICLLRKAKFLESKVIKYMNFICLNFSFLIAEGWLPSSVRTREISWCTAQTSLYKCVFFAILG